VLEESKGGSGCPRVLTSKEKRGRSILEKSSLDQDKGLGSVDARKRPAAEKKGKKKNSLGGGKEKRKLSRLGKKKQRQMPRARKGESARNAEEIASIEKKKPSDTSTQLLRDREGYRGEEKPIPLLLMKYPTCPSKEKI